MRHHRIHNQTVPILYEDMAKISRLRSLAVIFAIQVRIRIRFRGMGLVAAPIAVELPRCGSPVVRRLKAFLAGPGLNQGALDREALVRQARLGFCNTRWKNSCASS